MKKLFIVAGARPNFMKVAPILRELGRGCYPFEPRLIHTGQHYDREMSEVFFRDLEIPTPNYHLEVGSGTHAEQTAKIMLRFEETCQHECPDLVMVVGDVNSTLACSIVAKKLQLPVAHVEAGLRSHDRSMPEEINRLVTDAISDYLFVTEPSGMENLLAEGKDPSRLFLVGHVMIDNLYRQLEKIQQMGNAACSTHALKSELVDYGVVTLHRPANVDDAAVLRDIMSALTTLAEEIPLIFPVHPRTRRRLEESGLTLPAGIKFIPPLPYLDFLYLFKDARLVLTDSGGLQEETTALGIPCLTLRENTERPVTVSEGTNTIVGRDPERILRVARTILEGRGKSGRCPELWDGQAARRILDALVRVDLAPA